MASGTIIGPTIGGGYRLEIDWSEANANAANDTSDVTAKVYWCSLGSAYTISSSSSKTGSTSIGSDTSNWSVSDASLTGNQRRLLNAYTSTVTHNADGTKSITLKSTFNCDVTLGGTLYNSTTASGTVTLTTINRGRLNVKVNGSWKNGQVFIKVNGTWKQATGVFKKVSGTWQRSQ